MLVCSFPIFSLHNSCFVSNGSCNVCIYLYTYLYTLMRMYLGPPRYLAEYLMPM